MNDKKMDLPGLFIAAMLAVSMVIGCASVPAVDNSVVTGFELTRYLGEWYEIARFDHAFERGVEGAKAMYTMRADGRVDVQNFGVKDGKPKMAKGIAKTTDTPGHLRVTFFWPFYGDYRVMAIDEAYSHALVGSGDGDYLWILSRTPKISSAVRDELLSEATRRGYDVGKLIWVVQPSAVE